MYLDADFDFGVRVGDEKGDDFVGDGDESQFGRRGVDRNIAVERLGFGRAG